MTDEYIDIIREDSSQLEPQPTGVEAQLMPLVGIRAILFDIYGTLLVSASGDIGAADPTVRGDAFAAAMEAVGWDFTGDGNDGATRLRATVEQHHTKARQRGVTYPEVDIVKVW
ncbi:MAG: hypothetical protein MI757_19570, partial [Pirellulales bacterium]|nr:hypothetical protein [Pirellulales bacterium]